MDYNVNMLPFPHPAIITVNGKDFQKRIIKLIKFSVVRDNGPAFFFGALMFNFVIQLGQIVTEKELHLRDYMQLMGLKVIF